MALRVGVGGRGFDEEFSVLLGVYVVGPDGARASLYPHAICQARSSAGFRLPSQSECGNETANGAVATPLARACRGAFLETQRWERSGACLRQALWEAAC